MALAYVQAQTGNSGASPAASAPFSSSTTTGNLIVVVIGMDGGNTGDVTNVVGSDGTAFTKVTAFDTANGAGTLAIDMWYGQIVTGGSSFQATVTFVDTHTNATFVVQEFSGFTGVATPDQTATSTGTSTSPSSGATGTTATANELVVGGAVHASTASNFSAGSGFSDLTQRSVANRQTAMESKVVSSTGSQTATFTIAASKAWICGVTTFYDYTGGGGSTGQIKTWNGSAFVAKPVKVWNGSAWVTKPLKVYNGSSWVVTNY